MFDLLEEDLLTKTAEPEVVLPPRQSIPKEPIVYAMPEKFRVAPARTSPALIVALVGGGALLFSGIFLAVILLNKPADGNQVSTDTLQVIESAQDAPPPLVSISTDILSTSTESTLDSQVSIIEQTTTTEAVAMENITSTIPVVDTQKPSDPATSQLIVYEPGIDSDSDGLTDAEERLFGTNPEKPDTDEDGYLDGNEFRSGFDPLKSDKSKLDAASYISRYANEIFGYSILHPQLWIAKSVPSQEEREVLISSATGEFIAVSVKENPKKLAVKDWVAAYSENVKTGSDASVLAGMSFIETEDGLQAYAVPIDANGFVSSSVLLHFKYEPNTKPELNFISTFQMIVRSLQFKQSLE